MKFDILSVADSTLGAGCSSSSCQGYQPHPNLI